MAAFFTGPTLAATGAPGDVHTTSRNPLLMRVRGTDVLGNDAEYIYLKGVASTIVGTVVTYDNAGLTTLIGVASVGLVAVSLGIVDAVTKFGWYGIVGTFPTDVVANTLINARLGRETTDGKVGDGPAAGDTITGAVSRAATTVAAVVNCQYFYPSVNSKSA